MQQEQIETRKVKGLEIAKTSRINKVGGSVRSKTWTAQVNEVLCKIICHNICVVIQEMHELGINPDFVIDK